MAEEEEKKPKNMGKILVLVFMLFNLLVVGGGFYLVYMSTLGFTDSAITEKELDKELKAFRETLVGTFTMFTMAQFNTNLNGLPRRIIRLDVNLEMIDREGFEEIMGVQAETRDVVIKILNTKKFVDIESVQGKLQLKNDIIEKINKSLARGVVQNVYFSNFQVQ